MTLKHLQISHNIQAVFCCCCFLFFLGGLQNITYTHIRTHTYTHTHMHTRTHTHAHTHTYAHTHMQKAAAGATKWEEESKHIQQQQRNILIMTKNRLALHAVFVKRWQSQRCVWSQVSLVFSWKHSWLSEQSGGMSHFFLPLQTLGNKCKAS